MYPASAAHKTDFEEKGGVVESLQSRSGYNRLSHKKVSFRLFHDLCTPMIYGGMLMGQPVSVKVH